jgi:predicted small secreted protein
MRVTMETGTWRKPGLLLAMAALLLSACVDGMAGAGRDAPTAVVVAGGQLTIAGPRGFCIDKSASRDSAKGAFVLLGSCASLSGSTTAARPRDLAVVTVSAYPGGGAATDFAAGFPAMAKFLTSAPGRAALSRSGKAATVQILAITSRDGVMFIPAADSAPAPGQRVEADYWRALLALKGQIVTLSVLGLKAQPLPAEAKLALLQSFVTKLQAANR